jgi:hypothetical protein
LSQLLQLNRLKQKHEACIEATLGRRKQAVNSKFRIESKLASASTALTLEMQLARLDGAMVIEGFMSELLGPVAATSLMHNIEAHAPPGRKNQQYITFLPNHIMHVAVMCATHVNCSNH